MAPSAGWGASTVAQRATQKPVRRAENQSRHPLRPGRVTGGTKNGPGRARGARLPLRVAEGSAQAAAPTEENLKDLPLPKMSRGLPLVGDTLRFAWNGTAYAVNGVKKHGPVFRSRILGKNCVFIAGEGNVRRLLQEEAELLEMVTTGPQRVLMGPNSMGVLNGEAHERLRRLTAPTFTSAALSTHIPEIEATIMQLFSEWAEQRSIKFVDEAKRLAFRIISDAVLGMDLAAGEMELLDDFDTFINGVFSFGINLGRFTKYGRALRAKERLLQSVNKGLEVAKMAAEASEGEARTPKLLEEVWTSRDPETGEGGARRPKLLEKLWTFRDPETGERLTEDEIRDHVMLLLTAGYSTTAGTLMQIILEIGRDPRIMSRLQREQEAVVVKHGEYMGLKALQAMPYADACVREALRVNPILFFPLRKVVKEFEVEGVRVPAGWTAFPLIGYVTRYEDARWHEDKDDEVYDPDRLLGTKEGRKQGAWMPFGIGPHACLGQQLAVMEGKIFLATLARHFEAWVPSGNLFPKYTRPPIVEPKDGLPLDVSRRIAQ